MCAWVFFLGFPCGSAGKESVCNVGNLGSIPGLGRSPGEGKGYPIQYSGLENSLDCIVHGIAKTWIQLSDFHFTSYCSFDLYVFLCYYHKCFGYCNFVVSPEIRELHSFSSIFIAQYCFNEINNPNSAGSSSCFETEHVE